MSCQHHEAKVQTVQTVQADRAVRNRDKHAFSSRFDSSVSRQAFVGPQGQNSGSAHAYVGPGAETVVGFTRRQSGRSDRRY